MRRPRGRPRALPDARGGSLTIRLTPEERELLDKAAELKGLTVSEYTRRAATEYARWLLRDL